MGKLKSEKRSCRDVFNAFLVALATYVGFFEIPVIQPCHEVPNRLIPFSKAVGCKDHDQWVHFYEFDYLFERLWRDPRRYLPTLKRFNGVIPCRTSRSTATCRWSCSCGTCTAAAPSAAGSSGTGSGSSRTCAGATAARTASAATASPRGCTIAVGTVGALGNAEDRAYFVEGLAYVVRRLRPKAIVVYGVAPEEVFGRYRAAGIEIVHFDSETSVAHSRRRAVA